MKILQRPEETTRIFPLERHEEATSSIYEYAEDHLNKLIVSTAEIGIIFTMQNNNRTANKRDSDEKRLACNRYSVEDKTIPFFPSFLFFF